MDLIERQDAIKAIGDIHPLDYNAQSLRTRIEQLPSAEPVIRCKDCKHWYSDADTGMACEFTNMSQPEDGFCNWAERRTDERLD